MGLPRPVRNLDQNEAMGALGWRTPSGFSESKAALDRAALLRRRAGVYDSWMKSIPTTVITALTMDMIQKTHCQSTSSVTMPPRMGPSTHRRRVGVDGGGGDRV